MNAYIECYNGVEQPIREGFQTYTGWMKDPEAGPTGKEAQPRSPGKLLSHRVDYCGQPLTDALAKTLPRRWMHQRDSTSGHSRH